MNGGPLLAPCNMAVLHKEADSPSFSAFHIEYHLSMIAITVLDSWAFVLNVFVIYCTCNLLLQ